MLIKLVGATPCLATALRLCIPLASRNGSPRGSGQNDREDCSGVPERHIERSPHWQVRHRQGHARRDPPQRQKIHVPYERCLDSDLNDVSTHHIRGPKGRKLELRRPA